MGRTQTAALFLALALTACTSVPVALTQPELEAELSRRVEAMPAPGMAAAATVGGRATWAAGFGQASLEPRTPADNATTYMWLSMTKVVTATAVMLLVERGQLKLDDPVGHHIEGLSQTHADLTVRQLLSHASGLPNPMPVDWIHLDGEPKPDPRALLHRMLVEHGELEFTPGEDTGYSNIGYLLLGEIVAQVSNRSYEQFVTEELLTPLGMENTGFAYRGPVAEHAAVGHQKTWTLYAGALKWMAPERMWGPPRDGYHTFRQFYLDGAAWGGLIGSTADAARFLALHTGGAVGGAAGSTAPALLSPAAIAAMQRPFRLTDGSAAPYGMGWHFGGAEQRPYVFHMGGGGGFFTEMRVYPGEHLGVVAMTNASGSYSPRIGALSDALDLIAVARWE